MSTMVIVFHIQLWQSVTEKSAESCGCVLQRGPKTSERDRVERQSWLDILIRSGSSCCNLRTVLNSVLFVVRIDQIEEC